MKGKALVPLVLGLVVGLFAVKLLVDFVRKAQASNPDRMAFKAVRAKIDIPAYSAISHEMVELIESSDASFMPAQERFGDLKEVINRVPSKSIPAKAPVLKSMLAPEGTRPGMVGRIPSGFRAFTVKIDEISGLAYQLKVGDWVDLIVVMDVSGGEGRKKNTVSEVILQHIQVAGIGLAATGSEAEKPTGAKVKPAKSATLFVPEQDVPKLHLAATRGKVSLSLRGEDDERTDSVQAAHSSELLKSLGDGEPAAAPKPAPLVAHAAPTAASPQGHEVLIHRGSSGRGGDDVERITFENGQSTNVMSVSHGGGSRSLNSMMGNRGGRGKGASRAANHSESALPPESDPQSSPEDLDIKKPGEPMSNLEPSDEGDATAQPEDANEDQPEKGE